MDIKRKDAAKLIDAIRVLVAEDQSSEGVELIGSKLGTLLEDAGFTQPQRCTGEAHSNAFIESCGVCLGKLDWGWVGEKTKVK